MTQPKTLIIGIGNPLMSDEGVGIQIIEEMEKTDSLPPDVTLLDGGTAGYALLDYMQGFDRVIIIDAVRGGGKPGTIYRLSYDDIIRQPDLKVSGHQIDLSEVLALARKLGELPELLLVGIEPGKLDYGMTLSPEVRHSAKAVMGELFQ